MTHETDDARTIDPETRERGKLMTVHWAGPNDLHGTRVELDGDLVQNVANVRLTHNVGEVPRLELDIIGLDLETGDYATSEWAQRSLCVACHREIDTRQAVRESGIDPEALAKLFHDTYERLAPDHGYETRPESAKPWDEVWFTKNGQLMVAVAQEILGRLVGDATAHGHDGWAKKVPAE